MTPLIGISPAGTFMPAGKAAQTACETRPLRQAVNAAFATRTSKYGYGIDVRGTYAHLPC